MRLGDRPLEAGKERVPVTEPEVDQGQVVLPGTPLRDASLDQLQVTVVDGVATITTQAAVVPPAGPSGLGG